MLHTQTSFKSNNHIHTCCTPRVECSFPLGLACMYTNIRLCRNLCQLLILLLTSVGIPRLVSLTLLSASTFGACLLCAQISALSAVHTSPEQFTPLWVSVFSHTAHILSELQEEAEQDEHDDCAPQHRWPVRRLLQRAAPTHLGRHSQVGEGPPHLRPPFPKQVLSSSQG